MDHRSAEDIAAMLGMDARSDIVQEAWRAQQHQAQQAAQREKKRRRVERMLGDHLIPVRSGGLPFCYDPCHG